MRVRRRCLGRVASRRAEWHAVGPRAPHGRSRREGLGQRPGHDPRPRQSGDPADLRLLGHEVPGRPRRDGPAVKWEDSVLPPRADPTINSSTTGFRHLSLGPRALGCLPLGRRPPVVCVTSAERLVVPPHPHSLRYAPRLVARSPTVSAVPRSCLRHNNIFVL